MSYYIQDNQQVVKTEDKKILLFIKGGDNNLTNLNNRRLSSWHLQGVYSSEEDYKNCIAWLIISDVQSGSWQFKSLRNKKHIGFTKYENTVQARFERALKKSISYAGNFSDITIDNIHDFENDLVALFRNAKVSLKDEDGDENYRLGLIWGGDKEISNEEASIKRLQNLAASNIYEKYTKEFLQSFRNFQNKYANSDINTTINDRAFCEEFSKLHGYWTNPIGILESGLDDIKTKKQLSYQNFKTLVVSNDEVIKRFFLQYDFESFVCDYPFQLEKLVNETDVALKIQKIINALNDGNKYDIDNAKTMEKNFNYLACVDFETLKNNLDLKMQKEYDNAQNVFVENWNSLLQKSWYTNTNIVLADCFARLEKTFNLKAFSLDEVKNRYNSDLSKIYTYYVNQRKKNQTTIKKVFSAILENYGVLLDSRSAGLIQTILAKK